MRAVRRALGAPFVASTIVECHRRRDGLVMNFIAFGRNAQHAQNFIVPGGTYVIEYQDPDVNDDPDGQYDGEIIGIRDVSDYN
jgi:hypothetical protein